MTRTVFFIISRSSDIQNSTEPTGLTVPLEGMWGWRGERMWESRGEVVVEAVVEVEVVAVVVVEVEIQQVVQGEVSHQATPLTGSR